MTKLAEMLAEEDAARGRLATHGRRAAAFARLDRCRLPARSRRAPARLDPGHVVMRRLSRYEYANTVRDLFLMSKPAWKYFAAARHGDSGEGH